MKFFVCIKLLFFHISLAAAIHGAKKKRRTNGLIFRESSYTDFFCSALGCKGGKGYTGSNDGECYSVNRCTKCKKTNSSESSLAYCSVIPPIKNEVTVFHGFLKFSKNQLDMLKSGLNINGVLNNNDELETDESESSQEDGDNSDEDDEEYSHEAKENSHGDKNISKVSYLENGSSYSLLELVSQIAESESESEEENLNTKHLNKPNKPHSKSLLGKFFGKKKKTITETNQAAKFKKTNRFSFNLNSLKNKFRNKSGSDHLDLSSSGVDKGRTSTQNKMNSAKIPIGAALELEATGSVLGERLNACAVS